MPRFPNNRHRISRMGWIIGTGIGTGARTLVGTGTRTGPTRPTTTGHPTPDGQGKTIDHQVMRHRPMRKPRTTKRNHTMTNRHRPLQFPSPRHPSLPPKEGAIALLPSKPNAKPPAFPRLQVARKCAKWSPPHPTLEIQRSSVRNQCVPFEHGACRRLAIRAPPLEVPRR